MAWLGRRQMSELLAMSAFLTNRNSPHAEFHDDVHGRGPPIFLAYRRGIGAVLLHVTAAC